MNSLELFDERWHQREDEKRRIVYLLKRFTFNIYASTKESRKCLATLNDSVVRVRSYFNKKICEFSKLAQNMLNDDSFSYSD